MTKTQASTYREYWDRGYDSPTYLGREVGEHFTSWNGMYRKVTPPEWAIRQACGLGDRWGPRPAELQEFVVSEKRAGLRDRGEIYRDARRWYARDRGESTLRELLEVLESVISHNPEIAAPC